jgi:hypothetical protein
VIQNITAYNAGTGLTQATLGFVRGATYYILKKRSAQNPYETVEYVGELTLREGDKIRVEFTGCTLGDTLRMWASGYKRRL